ncbi:carboxymuconolactone decarboxylase family protein [Modestobacter roseus]|uniref:Putative peroxidase-related enzyme n=1 Tax=Modestobacter roseus TaxID=1181884 RepID=A0A562IR88_9ACTN|nr:peroxidase [Modestobacter roseus]MQA33214.1 peroxidase [Modestobacter roseus]TWH73233.1 putative peroxidase-related enzyme [Modestobacter roseus]
MSWIATPEESAATGTVAAVYAADRDSLGHVTNHTRVFAQRPEVLAAWRALSAAIKDSMGERRYELATLGAAARLRSSYCSLAHGWVLAERHLDAGTVATLVHDPRRSGLDPAEIATVELAARVAGGAAEMTEDDLDAAREAGLGDGEVLDVVLAAAARMFFSSVLDAVGAEPDRDYAELPAPLRDALTVGRPIEAGPA